MMKLILSLACACLVPSAMFFSQTTNKQVDTLIVHVKVEIRQGVNSARNAKSYDFVGKKDYFDVSVKPLYDCNFYLVHYNSVEAAVIAKSELTHDRIYSFPESESYYQIDGAQKKENLVLIFAKNTDKYLENYDQRSSDLSVLKKYLSDVEKNCRIQLEDQSMVDVNFKGSVRGIISKLAGYVPYIGNGSIVKTFVFNVSN